MLLCSCQHTPTDPPDKGLSIPATQPSNPQFPPTGGETAEKPLLPPPACEQQQQQQRHFQPLWPLPALGRAKKGPGVLPPEALLKRWHRKRGAPPHSPLARPVSGRLSTLGYKAGAISTTARTQSRRLQQPAAAQGKPAKTLPAAPPARAGKELPPSAGKTMRSPAGAPPPLLLRCP